VNPKIAGKWMFIPLKMVLIGIDPYPHKQQKAMDPAIALSAIGVCPMQSHNLVGGSNLSQQY